MEDRMLLKQVKKIIAAVVILWAAHIPFLVASEDSIEAVLEDYESPQKLFMNVPNAQEEKNNTQSQSDKTAKVNATKADSVQKAKIHPQDVTTPIMPQWIYSTAIIETNFSDGSFKKGLGTLLKNGFYLTSSEVVYNGKIMPKAIYVKMQDDMTASLICVSKLQLKAVDLDAGLALLKVSQSVDDYCQLRPQTYYQDRIFKRYGIDIFVSHRNITPYVEVNYPYFDEMFVFVPQSMKIGKVATYYDFDKQKEQGYGFEISADSYEEHTYGRAFYDDKGVFLGMMSRAGVGYVPVFIERDVVQDFLCNAQENEIINDDSVKKSCQVLGKNRKRFFTDMKGMANFY